MTLVGRSAEREVLGGLGRHDPERVLKTGGIQPVRGAGGAAAERVPNTGSRVPAAGKHLLTVEGQARPADRPHSRGPWRAALISERSGRATVADYA